MPVQNTSDSNKFPIESCRERIARRYGLDAVALSGPCKGAPLTDCVCKQLSDRWENISNRFAKNEGKVVRLAEKLAGSFMEKDDSDDAVKSISEMGYEEKTAANIANYLHAYAMPGVLDEEINSLSDEVDSEDELVDEPVADEAIDEVVEPVAEEPVVEEPVAEEPVAEPVPEAVPEEGHGGEEMVSIEIPAEVAEELKATLEVATEPAAEEGLMEEPAVEMETVEEDVVGPEEPAVADEPVAEEPVAEEPVAEVPGEDAEKQEPDTQIVESKEQEGYACGETAACGHESSACGTMVASEGKEAPEKKEEPAEKEAAMKGVRVKVAYPEFGSGNKPISDKEKEVEDPKPVADGNLNTEGHAAGDNKFQDGKTMGAEEKFDAKEVDKSEVSGGSKSLQGKDESLPEGKPDVPAGSAPIGGEELTGGNVSTKGTVIATITPKGIIIETPEGKKFHAKASIPAEHATEELSNEIQALEYEGDGVKFAKAALATYKKYAAKKTQIQATITPKGVAFKTPEGKAFLAKVEITKADDKMVKAVESVSWEGDVQKFANGLVKAVKTAATEECCDEVKTDTSEKEAKDFTNDAEKKPEKDASAPAPEQPAKNEEGQVKTDTAKLEAENFTNDAEKKPDTEASSKKEVKQAADKDLKNAPIADGNLQTDGYSAGDKKFQDGKTMGAEEKFDADKVEKSEVSAGSKSEMGKDEELPKGEFKVPSEDADTNTMTKGTVIAEQEAKLREARLKAASIYVADLLRHNEISEAEYDETLEKVASMPIPAIQQLALSTRKTRDRVAKAVEAAQKKAATEKEVGLGLPVVISSNKGNDLTERLAKSFSLTKKCDDYEDMKKQ